MSDCDQSRRYHHLSQERKVTRPADGGTAAFELQSQHRLGKRAELKAARGMRGRGRSGGWPQAGKAVESPKKITNNREHFHFISFHFHEFPSFSFFENDDQTGQQIPCLMPIPSFFPTHTNMSFPSSPVRSQPAL